MRIRRPSTTQKTAKEQVRQDKYHYDKQKSVLISATWRKIVVYVPSYNRT